MAGTRINTKFSLTICEGISRCRRHRHMRIPFPHYMWGYIARLANAFAFCTFPSLYVRVYRYITGETRRKYISLTICEGISCRAISVVVISSFHHYMWGYIDDSGNDGVYQDFPSLYVRVYREKPGFGCSSVVSLTICEGISIPGWFPDHTDTFPHYMWGYISISLGG